MSNNMKTILLVAPYFPPHSGGLERYSFEIAQRLQNEYGYRVVVITSGEYQGSDSKEYVEGLIVYRLAYEYKISNTPLSFSWPKKIKKIYKDETPDLINIHAPVPGIVDVASWLAGEIPVIVTYHTGSMHKRKIFFDILIWLYEHCALHFMLKRADRIVCSSDFVRLSFLHKYAYKSSTITPAVDGELFVPNVSKKAKQLTILFVAGLFWSDQHKGLQKILDILPSIKKQFPDIQLVVVGEGDMREEYEYRVRALGLTSSVRFAGKLFGEKLSYEFQAAHIFVAPSQNESFSMVTLEAMSSGLPVVASNVGGIPLLVDNGKTGLLFPYDENSLFEKHILTLLMDPILREQFGTKGREKVKYTYDWGSRAKAYDILFREQLSAKTKKRLLVVAPYFYPQLGGVENYTYNIARHLNDGEEYEVSVITTNLTEKKYNIEIIDGMKVYRLPYWFKISNTPVSPLWYWSIKNIMRVIQPDLVYAHTPVPYMSDMAERARGEIPFILAYHNDLVKEGFILNQVARIANFLFVNKTLRGANGIIATSQLYADNSRYLKKYMDKLSIIPPGVNLQVFHDGLDKSWLKHQYGKNFTVLFVGILSKKHYHKGVPVLFDAISMLQKKGNKINLVLVGSGDAVAALKQEVNDKKLDTVYFAGRISDELLAKYYSGADVTVLPSTTSAEGFGMVLLESSACGTAVVGSNIGGISQAVENEKTGLLVAPNDPHALADAIERLMLDAEAARIMGTNGARRVREQFGWKIQSERHINVFSKILHT